MVFGTIQKKTQVDSYTVEKTDMGSLIFSLAQISRFQFQLAHCETGVVQLLPVVCDDLIKPLLGLDGHS